MTLTGLVLVVDVGGFTIRDDDSVVVKLMLFLKLPSFSINPHRQAIVHPLVEPPFLFVSVASS